MNELLKLKRLLSISKSLKFRVFEGTVERDVAHSTVTTFSGYLNGKLTKTVKVFRDSKNVGKSNEIDHWQRAKDKLDAIYKEKQDTGYKSLDDYRLLYPSLKITNTESILSLGFTHDTDVLGRPLPMLANKYRDVKNIEAMSGFVQPKLNGVRCISYFDTPHTLMDNIMKTVIYRSRGGEVYFLPHLDRIISVLIEELQSILSTSGRTYVSLDGEIYKHGVSLQTISGAARRKTLEAKDWLEYRVYDFILYNELGQSVNLINEYKQTILKEAFENFKEAEERLSYVETIKTNFDRESVNYYHSLYKNKGYEGIILRPYQLEYEPGVRSNTIIKVKEFQDGEFEVVDIVKGNEALPRECVVMCKLKTGQTFKVNPKLTHEDREALWYNREEYIGKFYTIQFFEYTDDNIPFHATGIHFRPKGE